MKNDFDYEITCFIDADNKLAGRLYFSDNCYADFDRRDIFLDSKPQKINAKFMNLLEALIINYPSVVEYDSLSEIYYGLDYYSKDTGKQTLRNFKSSMKKYVKIENKQNFGYSIELKKRIKTFKKIKKENVHDIRELFPEADKILSEKAEENSGDISLKSLEFSKKYFHSGANMLIDTDGKTIIKKLSDLSDIFNNISLLDDNKVSQSVLVDAYNLVVDACKNSKNKDVLQIKGPLGSYKNRIMQYMYLAILKNADDILPFYMDIAFYERIAETDNKISESDIIDAFNKDFDFVEAILAGNHNKTPVLFLDGVRDFSRGNESLYYCISKRIDVFNCKLVVCLDADFTVNNQHQFNVHPLGSDDFEHYMRIKSMSLQKRDESIAFIRDCIKISEIAIPSDVSEEKIYECLVRLSFSSIDAYWLVYILKTVLKQFITVKSNIADLYNAICIEILGNANMIDPAAELAYEFEFGSVDANCTNIYYDSRWKLIRKHRSMLDFLIAKHYVKKVSELNLVKGDDEQNSESLRFFNMVLQKNITRFVIAMLKGVDDYEYKIMIIAKNYYDFLSLFGKSELTFWMARLQNQRRKMECVRLLKSYHKKEIQKYNNIDFNNFAEKRDAAFLIRGINVSLIYENDREALEYYLNSLLTDKIANSVNRGFHLEYYGDKPYIPNKTLLDFEDDVTKGENTLTILCISLDRRIRRNDVSSYVAALEVMTVCNLIQARIEQTHNKNVFDVKPYIGRCLRYLNWIIGQRSIRGMTNVVMYFMWMHKELNNLMRETNEGPDNRIQYSHAAPFNKFSTANSVERTGWVKSGVPKPENIVEHMYNCWLIGMLYLPDEYHDPEYSKDSILKMLLIHDLGETETGDINRPEKQKNQHDYDYQESMVMQSLLLSGTYPGAVDLSSYIDYWKDWNAKQSINYYVAKDIDNIQTIFQFCNYYNQYPDIFTIEDIIYWLSGIDRIETDLGKDIAEKLITYNPVYADILKLMNEQE